MSDDDIKNFGYKVERIKNSIDSLNPGADVHETKLKIEELQSSLTKLEQEAEELDSEIQDSSVLSNKKPLINRLSQSKTDLDIAKRKLNEKKSQWQTKYNIELLKAGQLQGADRMKTEKDMILEQHRETDIQGDMINEIANNVKGANENLVGINSELRNQGEQIQRIHNTALDAQKDVNQADKQINQMTKRQKCMKVTAGLAIVLMAILDVFLVIFMVFKKFI